MSDGPSGLLALDKPAGPTSHDMVVRVRHLLGTRRVGHAGTLDPFATGLLLVLVGSATRLAEYFSGMDKSYETTLRLGAVSDTDDCTGAVVESSDAWRRLSREAVEAACTEFIGTIRQIPPAYSAKKIDGERLYRKARRGEVVQPEPVDVTVHELTVIRFEPPEVRLRVGCSSGTYVRAIGRDLGAALGVGAHLTELRRMGIGEFDLANAASMEDLEAGDPFRFLRDPVEGLPHLERFEVTPSQEAKLVHGGAIPLDDSATFGSEPTLALAGHRLVAVGFVKDGAFRPKKVFAGNPT